MYIHLMHPLSNQDCIPSLERDSPKALDEGTTKKVQALNDKCIAGLRKWTDARLPFLINGQNAAAQLLRKTMSGVIPQPARE
jgi:hypothetical protein